MDKSTVRHGRDRGPFPYGPEQGRRDLIAKAIRDDPVVPDKHGRKSTRRWCRGKAGREHDLVIRAGTCEWTPRWVLPRREDDESALAWWACNCQEACAACGKIMRDRWQLTRAECRHWPGDDSQKEEAEARAAAREARIRTPPSGWQLAHQQRQQARLTQMGVSSFRRKRGEG